MRSVSLGRKLSGGVQDTAHVAIRWTAKLDVFVMRWTAFIDRPESHQLQTNRCSSVIHNRVFYSGMSACFGLRRPSSGHHYINCKVRYNTV